MSIDSGPVDPLEQRCVKPGHWVIEGYTVKRHGTRWRILAPVSYRVYAHTLAEARDWIREHR